MTSQGAYDSCVNFKRLVNNSLMYLLLYVDDMLVTCKDFYMKENLKKPFTSELDVKVLSETKKILDMESL